MSVGMSSCYRGVGHLSDDLQHDSMTSFDEHLVITNAFFTLVQHDGVSYAAAVGSLCEHPILLVI